MRTYNNTLERFTDDPKYRETYEKWKSDLKKRIFIGVNKGWEPIVVNLHGAILSLEPEQYELSQIKEKFGGLRFYFTIDAALSKTARELVAAAEELAHKTCEICGAPGKLRTERSWLLTLCDKHNTTEPLAWDSGYSEEEKTWAVE